MKTAKTPDEIKKGLEVCNIWMVDEPNRCMECPYFCTKDCADTLMKHAFALIQQLETQVPRWIPVEERLPKSGEDVVLCVRCGDVSCVRSGLRTESAGLSGFICPGDSSLDGFEVTHWMPLPEPPEWESPVGGSSDDFVHGNHG